MQWFRQFVGVALFVLGGWAANTAGWAATPQFSRDVRPILAQNCFHCHGPDAGHRKADLRLDDETGLRQAFVPHNLEKSEGWRRIQSADPDERMPPPDSPHQLTPAQVATLRQWIEGGAGWQGHWAFVPPARPSIPVVKDASWVRHPIDAFIKARLEAEGLAPQEEADRERLLRRVTFDLTGLPPTVAEIDAFLADKSDKAYEKVVDRLLASEHYGERMALAWMDAARYGDSSVFHADGPRDMWAWRDWVIRAFNRNMPYDQFTREQLAGDLLTDATDDTRIATGFLRNNATTDEGGAIAEEFRVEYAVDRVKTTSVVWMGLTMECGQCHNHKYDPITQQEYYRYFAYFNQASDPGMQTRRGNQTPTVNVLDAMAQKRADELESQVSPIEAKLAERAKAVDAEFLAWAKQAAEQRKDSPPIPQDTAVYCGSGRDGRARKSACWHWTNVARRQSRASLNGAKERSAARFSSIAIPTSTWETSPTSNAPTPSALARGSSPRAKQTARSSRGWTIATHTAGSM
jgi:mono/diheme cytochrome c family protein